jgi:hypothetical protein
VNNPLSIFVCLPEGVPLADSDREEAEKRDVQLPSHSDADTGGVVGWSDGGWDALRHAETHPESSSPRNRLPAIS